MGLGEWSADDYERARDDLARDPARQNAALWLGALSELIITARGELPPHPALPMTQAEARRYLLDPAFAAQRRRLSRLAGLGADYLDQNLWRML
jgi:hypothetical protein